MRIVTWLGNRNGGYFETNVTYPGQIMYDSRAVPRYWIATPLGDGIVSGISTLLVTRARVSKVRHLIGSISRWSAPRPPWLCVGLTRPCHELSVRGWLFCVVEQSEITDCETLLVFAIPVICSWLDNVSKDECLIEKQKQNQAPHFLKHIILGYMYILWLWSFRFLFCCKELHHHESWKQN